MTKAKPFDASKYLTDDEIIRHYLAEAVETGDPSEIRAALGDAVKAKGTKQIAKRIGLTDKILKRMLAYEHVDFSVIVSIVDALGLRLTAEQSSKQPHRLKDRTDHGIASACYSRSTRKLVIEYETGRTSSIPITLFDHFGALDRKPRVVELQDVEVTDDHVGVRFPRLGVDLYATDFYQAVTRSN